MAILLGSFIFLGAAMFSFVGRYWIRDKLFLLSIGARQAAQDVTGIYAGDFDGDRREALEHVLEAGAVAVGAEILLVFDGRGRVVACAEDIPDTPLPSPVACAVHGAMRAPADFTRAALNGGYTLFGTFGGMFARQMLMAAEPFQIGGAAAGFVLAVQPISDGLALYVGRMFRLFLLSGAAALALAFVVVYFISYRLTRPLNDMARATQQYARGDFGYRVQTAEDNELRQLAEAFNSMAISLATLESSRRSFVANVSHELKTPMTSIGGFIDGILDGTIPDQQHKKYLELVSEEVKRLSRLVTGMLNLSKIEDGELQLNLKPFDISELLFTTILRFEQIVAAKRLELAGLDALEPVTLQGDRDMLTQVFYNLIDNAVKFTPPGGRLEFDARAERETYIFRLRNTGVGISSEELARVFERFYKTDKSRSFDVKGAGLGLYLARTIVKMHGGTISAASDGESYAQFTVELPC
jgi:signal transduction histidine kinase